MKIIPYLQFRDECEAAFSYYAKVLGGELTMTHFDSVQEEGFPYKSAETDRLVLHAHLKLAGAALMGSDTPPDMEVASASRVSVNLNIESRDEAERIFEALAKDGDIIMPLGATFWAQLFGVVKDKFGIEWMINKDN